MLGKGCSKSALLAKARAGVTYGFSGERGRDFHLHRFSSEIEGGTSDRVVNVSVIYLVVALSNYSSKLHI